MHGEIAGKLTGPVTKWIVARRRDCYLAMAWRDSRRSSAT